MGWEQRWRAWWPRPSFAGGYPCCCGGTAGSGSSEEEGSGSSDEGGLLLTSCTACEEGVASAWYMIQIAGVTAATGFCPAANCASVNGVYVLGPLEQATLPELTLCAAGEPFTGVCLVDSSCFRFVQIIFMQPTAGDLAGHYLLLVELVSQGACNEELGLPTMRFIHDFGTERPHCVEALPVVIEGGTVDFVTTPKCSAATATCSVSAISPP